jgi:hypothetical protein
MRWSISKPARTSYLQCQLCLCAINKKNGKAYSSMEYTIYIFVSHLKTTSKWSLVWHVVSRLYNIIQHWEPLCLRVSYKHIPDILFPSTLTPSYFGGPCFDYRWTNMRLLFTACLFIGVFHAKNPFSEILRQLQISKSKHWAERKVKVHVTSQNHV